MDNAKCKNLFDTIYGQYAKDNGISRKHLRMAMTQSEFQGRLSKLGLGGRIKSPEVLSLCQSVMGTLCDAPEEGWLRYIYDELCHGLFPQAGRRVQSRGERQATQFFLTVFEWLVEQEKEYCAFDPLTDICPLPEGALSGSRVAGEYEIFTQRIKETHFPLLLRLGRDIMPFDPASHTIGVHHVALHTAIQTARAGLDVDLSLISAASFAHDIGKFGCRGADAARIPYLHYYFTWQWLSGNGMPEIAQVASNHSTWDLEFENLPIESLLLIYADFRVRGERDANGAEHVRIYSLRESYDVIFSKLADMTEEKQRRYRTVYCKLRDFEAYLLSMGVNPDPIDDTPIATHNTDASLLKPYESMRAMGNMVFGNNVRLMDTITRGDTFAQLLEQARDEKNLQRIRTYLSLFEEYNTYMSRSHKLLLLKFLYELLMHHEGDVRRHSARIMGAVLANSGPRYRKELPQNAPDSAIAPTLNALLRESAVLWDEYIGLCLHPDHKISAKHAQRISNSLKIVAQSLFENCDGAQRKQYWARLYAHICTASDERFVLMDTLSHIPADMISESELETIAALLKDMSAGAETRDRLCALRACMSLLEKGAPGAEALARELVGIMPGNADYASVCLAHRIRLRAGMPSRPLPDYPLEDIYLDNLKTSVHWMTKLAHIDRLCEYVQDHKEEAFHIATHLSNILSVSEHLPVRERAGQALITVAPCLSVDQCNEIVVDLLRELETGQNEIARYIPPYLGTLICRLPNKELNECLDFLENMVRSSERTAHAALSALCVMLKLRLCAKGLSDMPFVERVFGLLLTGVAHYEDSVHLTALCVLCRDFFSDDTVSLHLRRDCYVNMGKKLHTLLMEHRDSRLAFFNRAAMLNHLYRFLTRCEVELGEISFPEPKRAAFFPGTFDPFSAGHKRIVQEIRKQGFEVYLAIDEFSWSKRTLPKLLRRQIANMSVADQWDVYIFPDDIPVNIAMPEDLAKLRGLFAEREMYIVAGSDVILHASAYQNDAPGSAAYYDHVIFSRIDEDHPDTDRDVRDTLRGRLLLLSLPAYYESASSTQIREYIDRDLDIAMLVDPVVQEFIYANALYLRAPQYKREMEAQSLSFECFIRLKDTDIPKDIPVQDRTELSALLRKRDPLNTVFLRDGAAGKTQGYIAGHTVSAAELYETLGDASAAENVRLHTSGRILVLDAVKYLDGDAEHTLLTLCNELLARSLETDHTYALYRCGDEDLMRELLPQLGFLKVPGQENMMYVDMRSPMVLIQDAFQRIKPPLRNDPAVVSAVMESRPALRGALVRLFPGKLLLCFDAELLNTALLRRVQSCNGAEGARGAERRLGPYMCVPYGKILSGALAPNTVTKTLHADKVFSEDVTGFTITEFPGYSTLQNQVRTIKSFRRPVLLVDDLLHNGYRLQKLDPLFREAQVQIERTIVGVLSGRGRDLMRQQGREVSCEYFIPNLLYWFTESLLYPFIGGDSVEGRRRVKNLLPSINLVLPYEYPKYLHGVPDGTLRDMSRICIKNACTILQTLEGRYQAVFNTSLSLKRLGEVLYHPRLPDKGANLRYDFTVSPSAYLRDDMMIMERISRFEEED